jgi:hypothetical protein
MSGKQGEGGRKQHVRNPSHLGHLRDPELILQSAQHETHLDSKLNLTVDPSVVEEFG